jgi:hypothetical protein
MALGTVRREAGTLERCPKALKTKLAHGGHQARGKRELENNPKKPRDLVGKLT